MGLKVRLNLAKHGNENFPKLATRFNFGGEIFHSDGERIKMKSCEFYLCYWNIWPTPGGMRS